MPTVKRSRASSSDDTDQGPAKRRAEESKEPLPQENEFLIQFKIKNHIEFDWIEKVYSLVKVKEAHEETVESPHGNVESASENSADEDNWDQWDSIGYTGSEIESEPDENAIGSCDALLLRNYHRGNFHDQMEEPSKETSALAFELFDRYGRLKPEFKEHPLKKGSGIWKDELDHGPILLIENILIDKPYRRRGLGKRAVNAVLGAMRSEPEDIVAMTQPGAINRDYEKLRNALTENERDRFYAEELRVAIAFWRSLGFRRIGSSDWFGLSNDESHLCHSLSASDDFDPHRTADTQLYPAVGSMMADIANLDDNQRLERVRQIFQETPVAQVPTRDPSVVSLLKNAATKDDAEYATELKKVLEHLPFDDTRYQTRDRGGNTILHTAANNFKPISVKWIMEQNALLANERNDEQETPLEALQSRLECQRTRSGSNYFLKVAAISDRFEGFSKEMIDCLCLLKGHTDLTSIAIKRLTFGCTCDQCIAGFLSPRMRHALLCQANVNHDTLLSEIDDTPGEDFVELDDYILKYVPKFVRDNMKTNKSMRCGFASLCKHFATCLESNYIPYTPNILQLVQDSNEWPPDCKNFLKRGGTVASVGSMLFERARQQDELAGDGEHCEVFGDEIEALPECRNDHEFGFVSGMCGFERLSGVRYVRSLFR